MEKVIYIYSLKDPRDYQIKYIGKTIDVNRRLKEHTKPYNLKTNSLKNNWLKHIIGLGLYPIMEVLEKCDKSNWEERERYWISYYKELGFELKNMTNGGEGIDGATMSDSFKLNLSKKRKGKNNPYYGKKHSKEIIKKISEYSKGRNNPRATFINVIDEKEFKQITSYIHGKVEFFKCLNHRSLSAIWYQNPSNERTWLEAVENAKRFSEQF